MKLELKFMHTHQGDYSEIWSKQLPNGNYQLCAYTYLDDDSLFAEIWAKSDTKDSFTEEELPKVMYALQEAVIQAFDEVIIQAAAEVLTDNLTDEIKKTEKARWN